MPSESDLPKSFFQPSSGGSAESRVLSEADRNAISAIDAAGEQLRWIQSDPNTGALLARLGSDTSRLRAGIELQETARVLFDLSQTVVNTLEDAEVAREESVLATRRYYRTFRDVALNSTADTTVLAVLGVHHPVSGVLGDFVVQANASYVAALSPLRAQCLHLAGFTPESLVEAITRLHELSALDERVARLENDVGRAIAARNRAIDQLQSWMRDLQATLQFALGRATPPWDSPRHQGRRAQLAPSPRHSPAPLTKFLRGGPGRARGRRLP